MPANRSLIQNGNQRRHASSKASCCRCRKVRMSSGPAFLSERLSYLEENIAAASLPLAEADLADLDAAPPAVGDRY
jgi:hypothetical protein